MKTATFTLAAIAIFNTGLAHADSLPITPGLWEITSTRDNPMTGQQQTQTDQECIVEDRFDPIARMGDDGCQVTNSDLDGNTLTFDLSCNMQGGQGTMHGVYTIDGDRGEGEMTMQFSFGGQTMSMQNSSVARRIGDC